MATLLADRLGAGYGQEPCIHGITLSFRSGEMVAIVGPNGSGKTTLLNALSGVLPPLTGEVRLDDRRLDRLGRQTAARHIAVVGQDALPDLDLTVAEVVALGRYPHLGRWRRDTTRNRQAVAEALAATGISALVSRRLTAVSGGERQRVGIARALAQEPELLLLDEPSSHLDIQHQMDVFDLLHRLVQGGLGVIAVLHDLNLAALYCNRLVLMANGRVVAAGTPEHVLSTERIQSVYGRRVLVSRHPELGAPQVTLLPKS